MTIIAGSFKGLTKSLQMQGFSFLGDVNWIKQPVRVRGVWRCSVEVKA
ncbi:hypothetical protein [Pseudomonas fluorescens]|nr:hypothetical protein [Pseudomonas fluorescens]